jgi:hypothetical protein
MNNYNVRKHFYHDNITALFILTCKLERKIVFMYYFAFWIVSNAIKVYANEKCTIYQLNFSKEK